MYVLFPRAFHQPFFGYHQFRQHQLASREKFRSVRALEAASFEIGSRMLSRIIIVNIMYQDHCLLVLLQRQSLQMLGLPMSVEAAHSSSLCYI